MRFSRTMRAMRKLALLTGLAIATMLAVNALGPQPAAASPISAAHRALVEDVLAYPGSQLQLELLLNGDCWGPNSATLTLTSTGTSASAVLVSEAVYAAQCDAAGHTRMGASVTTSYSATPSTFGSKHLANEEWRWVQSGTAYSLISVAGTTNCQIGKCR